LDFGHFCADEVLAALPEMREVAVGMLHLLIQRTSGICLCEHRDHGGERPLVATAWGEPNRGRT
jgi:hypothetical protein